MNRSFTATRILTSVTGLAAAFSAFRNCDGQKLGKLLPVVISRDIYVQRVYFF
ncbi:hypothetical protein H6G06_19940 [Anabaena sphaerica FACHB-251]|uniref:Uncharacterized protein n=1 Tax=Anabaena sphaerica FACHB-251 TaxID=2692883 RepID=A0A927A3H6_9NOST|nr:hypothetical protein [Anabaena sphaerica]MBD2295685.1 hypothetical protein [Anabaena sphaerica FACHB-251]